MLFKLNIGLYVLLVGTVMLCEISSFTNWKYHLKSRAGTGKEKVFSEYYTHGSH